MQERFYRQGEKKILTLSLVLSAEKCDTVNDGSHPCKKKKHELIIKFSYGSIDAVYYRYQNQILMLGLMLFFDNLLNRQNI